MTDAPKPKVNVDVDPHVVKESGRDTIKEAVVIILVYTFLIAVLKGEIPDWKHMLIFMCTYIPAVSILKSVHEDLSNSMSTALAIALGNTIVNTCFTHAS